MSPESGHDVFISYSHRDNLKVDSQKRGWISTFRKNLRTSLDQILPTECSVFMDPQLDRSRAFDQQLESELVGSRSLLVFLSPNYLNSDWCRREREIFLREAAGRGDDKRIVVVRLSDCERPAELSSLISTDLFEEDDAGNARLHGYPVPIPERVEDRPYYALVQDTARQLANAIRRAAGEASPVPERRPVVFLSSCTSQLEERRRELERYFGDAVTLLPEVRHPSDVDGFRSGVRGDMEKAHVFVQLLNGQAGEQPERSRKSYLKIQDEIAREVAESRRLGVIKWRCRSTSVDGVVDAEAKELLGGADVRAVEFADFMESVLQLAIQIAKIAQGTGGSGLPAKAPYVFIDNAEVDQGVARAIGDCLEDCFVVSRIPDENPEKDLMQCDAIVLVHGAAERSWVRDELRDLRDIVYGRENPPRLRALVNAPPDEKDELGLNPRWEHTIDCGDGVRCSDLKVILKELDR